MKKSHKRFCFMYIRAIIDKTRANFKRRRFFSTNIDSDQFNESSVYIRCWWQILLMYEIIDKHVDIIASSYKRCKNLMNN